MRKMFKAAASLAVGCAMLSTSAFAALTGSPALSDDRSAVNVTVSGVGASKESTILVLKGARTEMPATINEDDIVYINQQTAAADGTATYSMPLGTRVGDATAVTVFAGATDESAATLLGSVTLASEPGRDFITAADTTKATIKVDKANVNNDSMGLVKGCNIVSLALNTTAYPNAGGATAGYAVAVVDAEGNAIDGSAIFYSAERAKYVAVIPTTVTDYKFEVLGADAAANDVISKYGNMNEDKAGAINALDLMQFTKIYKKTADSPAATSMKKALIADVTGDGNVNELDLMQFTKAYKKQDYTFNVLTK